MQETLVLSVLFKFIFKFPTVSYENNNAQHQHRCKNLNIGFQ